MKTPDTSSCHENEENELSAVSEQKKTPDEISDLFNVLVKTQLDSLDSHTNAHYMDFVNIFNISESLDLSTIYFAHFNGC